MLFHKEKSTSVILLLASAGFAVMAYLTYVHYAVDVTSVCDVSARISCDIVNRSVFSEVFGVPVSVFGLAYFAVVFAVAAYRKKRDYLSNVVPFTLFSLVFSLYLTVLELFVIGAICLFCELSKALMIAILAAAAVQLRREGQAVSRTILGYALGAGLVFVAGIHLLQNAAVIP